MRVTKEIGKDEFLTFAGITDGELDQAFASTSIPPSVPVSVGGTAVIIVDRVFVTISDRLLASLTRDDLTSPEDNEAGGIPIGNGILLLGEGTEPPKARALASPKMPRPCTQFTRTPN